MYSTRFAFLGVLTVAALACAPRYAYRFESRTPGALPAPPQPPDVSVAVTPDPLGTRALALEIANHTPEPLDVGWTHISMSCPDGRTRELRPDTDLGWIPPGATRTANLGPFLLPEYGDAAYRYEGTRFVLHVPMSPHGEAQEYQVRLVAHVVPAGDAPRTPARLETR